MTGIKRNVSCKINQMLEIFPVVYILGSRQVGKTTLVKELFPTWRYLDLEKPQDLAYLERDPSFFFSRHPEQVIIDEAQAYPTLFNVLRGVVDEKRQQKGRFILTGSSSPDLLTAITESLAGRIGVVKLSPLKTNELHNLPLSKFYTIFNNKLDAKQFIAGKAPLTIENMQETWLYGGYPEPRLMSTPAHFRQWMEQYIDSYIYRDIGSLFPRINKSTFQRFLRMLGKLSGTIINQRDLARTIEVSAPTIKDYLQIIEGTFIWCNLSSYEKNIVKAIIKMPKGYLRDSGLLHYLLNIADIEELYHDPISGNSFEAYVIEELLRGIEATMLTNWEANYYRTRNGAEIDLILSGTFGILPIEIKQATYITLKQLTALKQFIEEHQLPFGIVINQSTEIEWLAENIVQLPIGWL